MDAFLEKVNRLKNWQVAIIFASVGFLVYSTCISNPFMGDDIGQIVNNPVVHSLANIRKFYEGSTFYTGIGQSGMGGGAYYRPLMTTTFSLLYTFFGPNSALFHTFQILLGVSGAFMLYLFLRYSFQPLLSIILSLIFLVHPVNSQVIIAIPSMQDALFFSFGMLAMWLLLRYRSFRSLFVVAACLLLSLLSKESGGLFIIMALVYLFWWDKKRFYQFICIMVLPLLLYIWLKLNAVGVGLNPNNAPIDNLNLSERLLTTPSVLAFYFSKLILPLGLSSGYYWINEGYTFGRFFLPLIFDLVVFITIILVLVHLRAQASKATFFTFLFFAIWCFIGLVPYLQLVPLDMTASETWLYFPMVGILGMTGVIIDRFLVSTEKRRYLTYQQTLLLVSVLIVSLLGLRTTVRGFDWKSEASLASSDIKVSKENYIAENNLALYYFNSGDYRNAKNHAEASVRIFPIYYNYSNYGLILAHLGDCSGARSAYIKGLDHGNDKPLYDNLGGLTMACGEPKSNRELLMNGLKLYPQDSSLWMYMAIFDVRYGDNSDAKSAILNAKKYGQVPQFLYDGIMNGNSFSINVGGTDQTIQIR